MSAPDIERTSGRPVRIGRRSRRLVAGIAVLGAALIVLDQNGLFPTPRRGTEVAGASLSTPALGSAQDGWDNLGRLRVPPPAAAPTAGAAAAPAAGDVAIAPPPDSFDAPAPPPPPPPPALRRSKFDGVQPEGGTWAVMVGINDYPGAGHDLRSAVADAEDVNEALGRMGVPGDHRLLMRNGQATSGTIRTAVDWLNAHAGPDAIAVLFYAGHIRNLGGGTQALIGADGGTITDKELASQLDGLRAKRAWIALAACYSGGFTEVLRPGRILTAAAPANSLAYENEAFGRSYLVQYMVRKAMIEGRAPASVEAAFAWARNEISRDYPNRTPVQYDDDPSDLDLRTTKSAPPPPQSPPPNGSPGGSPPSGGGSGGGATPPTQPPPDPNDGCANLTAGIVRCKG